ncbi:MAG: hypothetical protein J6038_05310 [Bacilli bacterium]|nr:hypothetical protein [Bacilli bacterium]
MGKEAFSNLGEGATLYANRNNDTANWDSSWTNVANIVMIDTRPESA